MLTSTTIITSKVNHNDDDDDDDDDDNDDLIPIMHIECIGELRFYFAPNFSNGTFLLKQIMNLKTLVSKIC